MEHLPVVNYGRISRITSPNKESPMEIGTSICLIVIIFTLMYLYKRYQDKSHPQSDNPDTLWL